MTKSELIRQRHSVRRYLDKKIEPEKVQKISELIQKINEKTGLHLQFMEPADGVYGSVISRLGGWKNVPAYVALIGPESGQLEEMCGYYGEQIVLLAQELGLNTCWAGMFRAQYVRADVRPGEKLVITIAVGYGADPGKPHKSKSADQVTKADGELPGWFRDGVEAALLAPTAINQQKFCFELRPDGTAALRASAGGPFVRVDLGIVRYHFQIGSGHPCSIVK